MPFLDAPPIRTDLMVPEIDEEGKLVELRMSREWQRWFTNFGAAVAGLNLKQLQEELTLVTQDTVDAVGAANFGDDYKGVWTARTHNVGNVRSYLRRYYRCIVARLAAHVNTPDNDPAGWELIGSAADLSLISQNNVDAIGSATFGGGYQGAWAAGVFAVGDVVSYTLRYYECTVARVATNTDSPATDTASWKLIGSSITIKANVQDNINALGSATYGGNYKGLWVAGVHAAGEFRSYGGRYYRCKAARTASNTNDPTQDNTGWEPVGSSFTLQGDIRTAKQENIDAAAAIVFGEDYQGVWAAGDFAVGDVSYDNVTERFYECDVARTAANTNRPSVDTSNWSSFVLRQAGVFSSRDRAVETLPDTASGGDLIWAIGGVRFTDWDSGIDAPSGESNPQGIAEKANGDILLVGTGTDKVYTYSNGSWDSGIDGPSGESFPQGIAEKANGDILLVGIGTDKVYTYSNGSWDSGIDGPSGESFPSGIAEKANGDILLVGVGTDKVYTYSNGSWDSGIDGPSGESSPQGIAEKANGDILLVGTGTDKVYTYSNGSWDSGIDGPSGESNPSGIAEKANGDILLVGTGTDKVYTATRLREIDRYVWFDGSWELTAIRAVE